MDAAAALARLRDPGDASLAQLADLIVDSALARPLSEVVVAERLGAHAATLVRDAAASEAFEATLRARARELRHQAEHDAPALGELLPPEVDQALTDLLAMPIVPSEELALRLLNHDAVRSLLRDVLRGTLSRFGAGLKSIDQGVLGGLGGKVARRGKGFLGGVAGAAEGLVGAVRDEFEGALERRVKDSLGQATDDALAAIARWVADPAHAESLGALRVRVAEIALSEPPGAWLAQLDGAEPDEVVDVIVAAVRRAAARDDLEAALVQWVRDLTAPFADQTLGTWTRELGIDEALRPVARDEVATWLHPLVSSDDFEAWWTELHQG